MGRISGNSKLIDVFKMTCLEGIERTAAEVIDGVVVSGARTDCKLGILRNFKGENALRHIGLDFD